MEKYGYMGIAAIQINRCDHCSEMWLDADELQNMVLALAKSSYRSEAAKERLRRESVDISQAGVQTATVGSRYGWLFDGPSGEVVVAKALLGLLLR